MEHMTISLHLFCVGVLKSDSFVMVVLLVSMPFSKMLAQYDGASVAIDFKYCFLL